ncbi:hypothetical protein Cgig2_032893 [Carnegiea gigantea]|uniref:Pectate lyase n=1 Tax=Carnegiea gigantea TaxID=171969 RepID=A0A9Q1Q894_9CARY|nr:hypothetical protein Cgig2_032893 [Carnegiea gigantea]
MRDGNPIDDCWRCDADWVNNRQRLADCAIGFGKDAMGGKVGRIYVATDSSDDDPANPKRGTLRHAVIQDQPLWITFQHEMIITLKQQLVMNSYKTIDGRGASVHITGGGCITVHNVNNIIIHASTYTTVSLSRLTKPFRIWEMSDGDGITIRGLKHIWVDHCSLAKCYDGLIDATLASTAITMFNNYMTHHNKVRLLGRI